jgi:hypothetical protein
VYLTAAEIAVIVPPGDMAFSQSYEVWSAGGCQVRCDGRWDHIGDAACHCDPSDRACDIHTRLSVIVPDLPGIGVWRLETHSYYAAVELGGIVDLCAAQAEQGAMLPARLRIEQRSVKRIDPKAGKVITRRFTVPVLDLDVHPLALGRGAPAVGHELAAGGAVAALPAASTPALPASSSHLTPVPQPDEVLRPSVADQVTAVNEPSHRDSRQAALPATGLKPRTVEEREKAAPAGDACSVCGSPWTDGRPVRRGRGGESTYVHTEHDAGEDAADAPADPSAGEATDREAVGGRGAAVDSPAPANPEGQRPPAGVTALQVVRKARLVFKAAEDAASAASPHGQKSAARTLAQDRLRHALVWASTKGRTASTKGLELAELVRVWQRLEDIEAGRLTFTADPLDDAAGIKFTSSSGTDTFVLWADFEDAPANEGAEAVEGEAAHVDDDEGQADEDAAPADDGEGAA